MKRKSESRRPLSTAAKLGWARYFAGRTLQMVGMLIVTGAAALFFGADAERRMLIFTAAGAATFIAGWLLAKKRPPAED